MVPNVTTIRPRFTTAWAARLQPDAMLAACGEVGDGAGGSMPDTPA